MDEKQSLLFTIGPTIFGLMWPWKVESHDNRKCKVGGVKMNSCSTSNH